MTLTLPAPEATIGMYGALGFLTCVAIVLGRVSLCQRAWGELPPHDAGKAPPNSKAVVLLAPNWRNRLMFGLTLLDGFMCAAPCFVSQAPWFTYVPLKLVARAVTFAGVWSFPAFVMFMAAVVTIIVGLAVAVLTLNYDVKVSKIFAPLCKLCGRDTTARWVTAFNAGAGEQPPASPASHRAAYERTAVSARDPRDGGYWQPRGQLSSWAVTSLYVLSTAALVPVLTVLAAFWTCTFPLSAISSDAPGSCTGGCWDTAPIIWRGVTFVLLMLLLPLVTIGFVSQERLDREATAAKSVVDSDEAVAAARGVFASALKKRHHSSPGTLGSDDSVSMGRVSGAQMQQGGFMDTRMKRVVAQPGSTSSPRGDGEGFNSTPNTRQRPVSALALLGRSSGAADLSLVLHLQHRTGFVLWSVVAKVLLVCSATFLGQYSYEAATLLCALINTATMVIVWWKSVFPDPVFDVIARVAHSLAAGLCWLVVLNSSFTRALPDLRLWGSATTEAATVADNSDVLLAGHAVVVATAVVLLILVIAAFVVYLRVVQVFKGRSSLFRDELIVKRAQAWDGSFWRRTPSVSSMVQRQDSRSRDSFRRMANDDSDSSSSDSSSPAPAGRSSLFDEATQEPSIDQPVRLGSARSFRSAGARTPRGRTPRGQTPTKEAGQALVRLGSAKRQMRSSSRASNRSNRSNRSYHSAKAMQESLVKNLSDSSSDDSDWDPV